MDDKNVCPICGEPTYKYFGNYRKDGLCTKHGLQANAGEIVLCEKCGKWHEPDKECVPEKEKNDHELTCIICGEPSNGYHFCKTCWQRYKDGAVDIRISNCSETEILDCYGNRELKTESGVVVRSKNEMILMDWFWNKKIRVVYEKIITHTDEEGNTITLRPDFYLPDYHDLYIEYNGRTDKKYLKKKEEAMKIYRQKKMNVEVLTEEDLKDKTQVLENLLEKYK